jgi:hypothetical protein
MTHVSSNANLFFKFFIPVFWTVFFTSFFIGLLISDVEYIGTTPMFLARIFAAAFVVAGALFFYLFVLPLKRIEMNSEYFIATNYFKNYKYSYDSIERIEERDWYFFRTYTIILKESGSFGKKINFVGSRKRFRNFREANSAHFEGIYNGV